MPNIYRYSIDNALREIKALCALGIVAIAIFPNISSSKKSLSADEAYNKNGLIQNSIRKIKDKFPNILIIRDGFNQEINVRHDNFYLFCIFFIASKVISLIKFILAFNISVIISKLS